MKGTETYTGRNTTHQNQTIREPFFSKEGQNRFFSKSNKASASFFSPAVIQPKLTIGQPNDKYEVEADAMADRVVQKLSEPKQRSEVTKKSVGSVQKKCATCEEKEKLQKKAAPLTNTISSIRRKPIFESDAETPDADVQTKSMAAPLFQTKCASCAEEEKLQKKEEEELANSEMPLQRKGADIPSQNTSDLERRLGSTKGGGSSLPPGIQTSMGSEFGADFSNVRIHTGTQAVQMSKELGAQAFTHGNDIYFNQGKYDANSSSGKHLLAHELTHTIQQNGIKKTAIQRQESPVDHLENLNEMLDRFNVPEKRVLALLVLLTPAEIVTVTTGTSYKNRMAAAFNIAEMLRAVILLNLSLEKKLEWIEAAAGSVSSIAYYQIQNVIITSSQPERDVLKTIRWRDFFVGVCDNSTIIEAVTDLHFNLKTQLEWIEAEASPWNIEYSQIKSLVISASQADRDVLKTIRWRDFFIGVCNNSTIIEAVADLHFDLKTQLEWIEEEASPSNLEYSQIKSLITGASQADRNILKTIRWRDFFVGICDNNTIIDAVIDLKFDLKTRMEWLIEEGTWYSGFKRLILAATGPEKGVVLTDTVFLGTLKEYFSTWNNFARTVELLGRVIPNVGSLMGNRVVLAALSSSWTASSAALTCGGGPTAAHEEGGWIYLNIITNSITTNRAVPGAQASIDLWSPPEVADSVIVGTFHTHPNVGPCWGAPFASPPDVTNANNRGVPNIVRGAFPTIANISDVFGGPSTRLHLAGSQLFPGSAGGVEPQTSLNGEIDFE